MVVFPTAVIFLAEAASASAAKGDGITEQCDAAKALGVPLRQVAGEALGLRSLGKGVILILLVLIMAAFATKWLGRLLWGILVIVGASLMIGADRAGFFDSFFQSKCNAVGVSHHALPLVPHALAVLGLA